MKMRAEREAVAAYGRKLVTCGLTKGTGGNISLYNDELGLMAISPSGMDYFETRPEDVVIVDLDGRVVEGCRKPSSELDLHRIFYMRRDDVRAVVHAHAMYSTVLATLGWDLPPVNYYIAIAGGNDIKCAKYETFGTWALACGAFDAAAGRFACFLANHGLLACSADLPSAFTVAEEVERMAEIYCRSKALGDPLTLKDEEIGVLLEKFRHYGQAGRE